jgi:tripartite ATP-independent transporter DctP family solute receptor
MRAARLMLLSVATAVAFAAASAAAQIQERTLRVGLGLNEDHPQALAVKKFGGIVTQKSGGKIKVRLFAGGALGNDATMISALRGGTQEMTVPDTSTLVGIVKDFGVLNFPFLFANEQEADAVLDGPFGARLLAKLPEKNLIGLAIWENGFRHVTNSRRPIRTAADLSGLKLRVIQNPLFIDTFSALGANALPMPFPEVYTALEQKTVDGQENPTATVLSSKFNEVQKNLVLTGHIYSVWVLLLSKKTWDAMSPQERTIMQEAAREATLYERATIREYGNKALGDLRRSGMQVTELPAAEQAAMRAKLKPVVDKYSKEFGEDTARELLGELEKVRARR